MSVVERLKQVKLRLPMAMLKGQAELGRDIKKIRFSLDEGDAQGAILKQVTRLEARLAASILERERRVARLPTIGFPEDLPITARREDIIRAITTQRVVIVSGETGSGKSTQIPKMCLAAGRGIAGRIGCTQPRRIAAATIARRIAEELGEDLGRSVGYKVRFNDRTDPQVYIKVMTDGMLLAETQGDHCLYEYDTLIIDEAHERSLNIDFILGFLRNLQRVRPELKIIVTSATLDTAKFSAFFDGAPVIEVSGRMYPVDVQYMPLDPELENAGEITYVDMAVRAADAIWARRASGDILIFMPTEQDIMETCERLEGRKYPGVTVLPLFARLPVAQQGRVYAVSGPKIVVATNVAETSLTIPGIRYVIDTGLARISRYVPRTRTTSLPVSPISRSSADQRKGRCGRVQQGLCVRLYAEEDYEARPLFTPPEILRSNLAEVILRMVALQLGDIEDFPFVDRPHPRSVKDGFDLLEELGAIQRKNRRVLLTERGRFMARMPLDPKTARMMLEAAKEDCISETAVIAAVLSIQDPRERPTDKAAQADQMHAPFKDPDSDFITLLNIWNRYHRSWSGLKTQNKLRKFCREHFLSFARMREWVYVHEQIIGILREQRIQPAKAGEGAGPLYDRIHRCVLSGFLSNIAMRRDKNVYQAAWGREVMIFPASTLFNKDRQWVVAAEIVKTSRLFARVVARIDPGWLEALGAGLCRRSYSEPHWEKNRGEVRAYEQVSLYGLPIVMRRPVSYGPINPAEAHAVFIQAALVEGQVKEPLGFLKHNQKLVQTISDMEDKVRRRDLLVNDPVMADFYSARLPGICDLRSLKRFLRARGDDEFLRMTEKDVLLDEPDSGELADFPDHYALGNRVFKCTYKFLPGEQVDGVTVSIPAGVLSEVPVERLEWGVPGFYREKVAALVKGLPKRYRKQLVPVSNTIDCIVAEMQQGEQPLLSALAQFVYERFGVDIPVSAWAEVAIPEHLRMRVSITDAAGRELEAARDVRLLERHADLSDEVVARQPVWVAAKARWEKEKITQWDFGDLPESIPLAPDVVAYPALEPVEGQVNLRLFQDRDKALSAHRQGVMTLLELHLAKDLKYLKRALPLSREAAVGAVPLGGARVVEQELYRSLVERCLAVDLRTREGFLQHAERVRESIFQEGLELRDQMEKILAAAHAARATIITVEQAGALNQEIQVFCTRLREDIEALLAPGFILRYPPQRLAHLPRYLKAVQVRAERGAFDLPKDRQKQAELDGLAADWEGMTREVSPRASEEKRRALEAFRWLLEEFKVSLFAQELKTPFPVSRKRLEKNLKEMQRMI